ncbi:MAG TPA: Rossmann-like and DUF2520 domain-containing protein [Candidatus Acidoferrales bacterium]|jgi:predicted short-subunit dehydrogenase-like oxidoreductase (DUF2520 family)|nr:Rossmann-like and DUF2520 domain-containing protein [Candidatus Acidoferrales bacterium]
MAMTLSIVGTGRVARALGRRLRELGWSVGAVTGRSLASARAAVHAIGAGQAFGAPNPKILNSSVILIATPDSAIESVAKNISEIGGGGWRGKVVLHTSGSLGLRVLQPLANVGASVGSMHPIQTFSDQNMPDLSKVIFGIDGSPAALQVARKMIRQMDGVAVRLSGANKAAYHAAGLFACGFVLVLMETGTHLLMSQGFKRRQALRALLPLVRQTLDNLESVGPRAAWTGPLSRGDFSTVERHVAALATGDAEFMEAYQALSRLTARLLSSESGTMLKQLEEIFTAAAISKKK